MEPLAPPRGPPKVASAGIRRSLSAESRSDPTWAAACSRLAWEAVRSVVPWEAVACSHCAAAAWLVCPPLRPPKGVRSQADVPHRLVGRDLPPCTRQALDPPDRSFGRHPHDRHWACLPGSLGVVSCLSPSPPRTLSHTLTRPTAAQAENPCSPLHRLAGGLRSHRLLSLGNSSLVGREHPRRCPGCSARAAAGSPSSRKSRSTCAAAPLNLRPVACWLRLAEVLCLLSEGARVR